MPVTIAATPTEPARRGRPRRRRQAPDHDHRRPDEDLFRRYRADGDRRTRNELIGRHRWLAVHCAKRFADKGEPFDDLVQTAMVGVLKAVERFDPDYGAAFATFAVPTVVGELRRHFRDTTWGVHVPRRAKDLQHTVKVAADDLGHRLGRSPTVHEIAEQAGIPHEQVVEAIEAALCYRGTPLETSRDDGDEAVPVGALAQEDRALAAVEAASTVERLLDVLTPRERHIVELRYVHGLTQARIGELVGVSQVQVSRLLRASLDAMRLSLHEDEAGCAM